MNRERNALKAGLFILGSTALIIGIVIGIKGIGQFLQPMQHVTISFTLGDDVGGLAPGDEVRVGGAKVGVVRSVELVDLPNSEHSIIVGCVVPRRFVLHEDAVVSIQSPFVGVTDLNFTKLGTGAILGEGQMLLGRPAPLAALLASGPDIMAIVADVRSNTLPKVNNAIDKAADAVGSYKKTADSATDLIALVRTKIDPIIERYFTVADSAKTAMTNLSEILGDTKPDIRATMANLREITAMVDQRLPAVLDKLDGGLTNVMTAVKSINDVLADVKQIGENTRDLTGSARQLLNTNRGKLDGMIVSLKTTADNLKGASAEIRRSPWRLLYQPSANEMNNLNLYDTTRQFADGASQLNDAATSLRDALSDPDVDKAQVEKLVERLDKSFANFNEIEAELWKQVKQ